MLIDSGGKPTTSNTLFPGEPRLSPELSRLISEMKLSLGQQIEAVVTKAETINSEQLSLLLAQKTQELKGKSEALLAKWTSLLNNKNLQFIQIKTPFGDIHSLTSETLQVGKSLKLLVTMNGLKLISSPLPTTETSTAKDPSTRSLISEARSVIPQNSGATNYSEYPATKAQVGLVPGNKENKLNTQLSNTDQQSKGKPQILQKPTTSVGINESKPISTSQGKASESPAITVTINRGHHQTTTARGPTAGELQPRGENPLANAVKSTSIQLSNKIDNLISSGRKQTEAIPKSSIQNDSTINKPLLNNKVDTYHQHQKTQPKPVNRVIGEALNSSLPISSKHQNLFRLADNLARSGVFFESNLFSQARNLTNTVANTAAPLDPKHIETADLKASLSATNQWITQAINSVQTTGNNVASDAIGKLWLNLLQAAKQNYSKASSNPPIKQILTQLNQQVEQSIARIQSQQLRSIASLTSEQTTSSSANSLHFDIPVRINESYGNIYMHINELKSKEKQNDKKKQGKKWASKWTVFLELDFGNGGDLAIELSISGSTMDATFWAANPNLREKVQSGLAKIRDDLEAEGLMVNSLKCQMGVSLIDTRT